METPSSSSCQLGLEVVLRYLSLSSYIYCPTNYCLNTRVKLSPNR